MQENEIGLATVDVPVWNEEEEEREFDEGREEENDDSGGDPHGGAPDGSGMHSGMCARDESRCVENAGVADEASGDASDAPVRETETKETSDAAETVNGREEARRRAREELREFFELYPDVQFRDIPASVRESALPLAAAYALYERRERRLSERAENANAENRARSAGRVADGGETFYTPDEVRRMTPTEVRADYDAILRSMKRWK